MFSVHTETKTRIERKVQYGRKKTFDALLESSVEGEEGPYSPFARTLFFCDYIQVA